MHFQYKESVKTVVSTLLIYSACGESYCNVYGMSSRVGSLDRNQKRGTIWQRKVMFFVLKAVKCLHE